MLKLTPEFGFSAAALLCASISAVYDVRSRRIPNFITLPAIAFGLLLHAAVGGWWQLATAAAGGLICGLIFFVFYLAGGMGAGDVKLITAAGCLGGFSGTGSLLILTALAGGVMALGVALYRRQLLKTCHNIYGLAVHHMMTGLTPHRRLNVANDRMLRLPYALAIAAGCGLRLCLLVARR
ncbi:MAG TPA: A24 family peptidase [Acidobacteriaceae bacterium]|nr:A24 family peptidase [Acidobacteriaceae bacterium]